MAEIRFDAHGADVLAARLAAAGRGVTREVGKAMRETTDDGVRIGKANAPVRTGWLRSEIGGTATELSGLVTSRAGYSGFVNFGTSIQAPNPFMGRTAQALSEKLPRNVAEAVRHL